ncbi:MAG TPA: hypothetical protein DEB15_07520, partial [Pusillimonas sp.]|nr:hypothetical protein [Pusillimonas sp.]
MSTSDFDTWLAAHLGQSPIQVTSLLRDKTAIRFLIAWSMLEAGCFYGFARGKELNAHCQRIVEDEGFCVSPLRPIFNHFHNRYQDKKRHKNLMHGHTEPDITSLLLCPIESLSETQILYFLVAIVYRYRNNIFHGSKGVESWLKYKAQIDY